MKKFSDFAKATLSGGILFILPVIVLIIILNRFLSFLRDVVRPFAEKIPYTKVAGLGVITLLSILLLLLACLVAGLFMRTVIAQQIKKILDEQVLIFIPGYSYLQAMSATKLDVQSQQHWKPATVNIDECEVLCFVTEETEHFCSIFLPDSPLPTSGSISVKDKTQVQFLPLTVAQANTMIRRFGKGAAIAMEDLSKK
jgi:uncharacterized membrane protein